jgi:hypothetical protein
VAAKTNARADAMTLTLIASPYQIAVDLADLRRHSSAKRQH